MNSILSNQLLIKIVVLMRLKFKIKTTIYGLALQFFVIKKILLNPYI